MFLYMIIFFSLLQTNVFLYWFELVLNFIFDSICYNKNFTCICVYHLQK